MTADSGATDGRGDVSVAKGPASLACFWRSPDEGTIFGVFMIHCKSG
ncbi:MAG: hypothetical protein Q8O25_09000 [Sulfurisoma sp.]|nr:hypothetical protein [Sulfurisoma sp.]